MFPTPRRGSAFGGAFGLLEHTETQSDDASAQEQGQQGVGGHQVPDDAETRGKRGARFGQQAGDSDSSRFLKNSSLNVFSLAAWLRGLESNQRLQVQSLAN